MPNRTLYGPQVKYVSTDAQRQQLLAQKLLNEGIDTSPVRGGLAEALARVGTAGIGGYLQNQAGETEKTYQSDRAKALAAALTGDPNQAPSVLMQNPATADLGAQLAVGNINFNRERAAKKEDFGTERQAKLEDIGLAQNFQREMAEIQQKFQSGQMSAQQAFQAAENAKNRQTQMEAAQLNRVPAGFQMAPGGGMAPIQGGPADPAYLGQKTEATTGAKMTDEQAKAAGYADRIREALPIIEKFSEAGTNPANKMLAGIPVVGNYMVGPEYQQIDQAKRNFVNAVLRRESGAVISDSEFSNADKQYFPQPGDGPEVLEQKKRNREDAIAGMTRSAGAAYKPPQSAPKATGGLKFLGFE